MIFKIIYKTVIIIIDINNILNELNALSFKKSQNKIEKLINMIETDCIVTKLFIVENVFVFSILSTIITFMTLNKTIKFFIETFKIMQLNNVKVVITNDVQRIINFNFYLFIAIVFYDNDNC